LDDPVWSRHRSVARYSKTALRAFADHTLAEAIAETITVTGSE
jgi:hypothetical protein